MLAGAHIVPVDGVPVLYEQGPSRAWQPVLRWTFGAPGTLEVFGPQLSAALADIQRCLAQSQFLSVAVPSATVTEAGRVASPPGGGAA